MFQLVRISLSTNSEQQQRLMELRDAFAQVCNVLALDIRASKIWNRVALHHMHYRGLREKFPQLGSQMVCNAIYSVSKVAKIVYQHPQSRYNIQRLGSNPLPLLQFDQSCPVYFDRHTLSLKDDWLSMYTLDGRMHFKLAIDDEQRVAFVSSNVKEVSLVEVLGVGFELRFFLESSSKKIIFIDKKLFGSEAIMKSYLLELAASQESVVRRKPNLDEKGSDDILAPIPQYIQIKEAA